MLCCIAVRKGVYRPVLGGDLMSAGRVAHCCPGVLSWTWIVLLSISMQPPRHWRAELRSHVAVRQGVGVGDRS